MAVIPFTFNCSVSELATLEITINIGLRQTQLDAGRQSGKINLAVIDFPNWDAVAVSLGLVVVDADGEDTKDPLPKPVFPLTNEAMLDLPFVLVRYIIGDDAIGDGLREHRETASPNLRRR